MSFPTCCGCTQKILRRRQSRVVLPRLYRVLEDCVAWGNELANDNNTIIPPQIKVRRPSARVAYNVWYNSSPKPRRSLLLDDVSERSVDSASVSNTL